MICNQTCDLQSDLYVSVSLPGMGTDVTQSVWVTVTSAQINRKIRTYRCSVLYSVFRTTPDHFRCSVLYSVFWTTPDHFRCSVLYSVFRTTPDHFRCSVLYSVFRTTPDHFRPVLVADVDGLAMQNTTGEEPAWLLLHRYSWDSNHFLFSLYLFFH